MRPLAIEELDENIRTLCTRINAATYELLVMIREFEQRGGYLKYGMHNTVEWLAWRCDLTDATAREKVRVARKLGELPLVSTSFSTGELSYSKVRSLTRVANPSNESDLVAFALCHTASQVAEYCAELSMGNPDSLNVAERAFTNRSLRIKRNNEKGTMSIVVDLPLDAGELVEKALDKARDDECLKIPDLVDTAWSKRQADAFVTMLKEYLSGGEESRGTADNYLVNIHVDQSALSEGVGRSSLPIEAVKRHCCDGKTIVMTETKDGEPLSIGRKSRIVPKAIERAVRARDHNCCSFPGCRNKRFLHIHHVVHWSNGGETALDNLVLLCTKHHTAVHEGGFTIRKNFQDRWTFHRPDGIAVPDCGYHAVDMLDEGASPEYLNPPRGGLLSAVEKLVNEPPPPTYYH
jgi:5-methylcytosine-specific restriction endonuclease McrA